jgi:aminoglycoside 3-N-acetyltransferase
MPTEDAVRTLRAVRRSELTTGIRRLGLPEGEPVLVHASLSSLGWVVGGAETVVRALLDAVGGSGTLAAVASWDDIPFRLGHWPRPWRRAYLEEMPGFDPEWSEANRAYGRFPERLRTWPGARKSGHPDQRVVAVGRLADWLTADHPLDDSFGPGSPFARLVEANGHVLMLGAPLRSLTLVHHAEAIASVPSKRRWSYTLPFATARGTEWRTLRDIDVDRGALPYGDVIEGGEDPLVGVAAVADAALVGGVGVRGRVAGAECHLFPAAELVSFASRWLEESFCASRAPRASSAAAVSRSTPAPAPERRKTRAGTGTRPR